MATNETTTAELIITAHTELNFSRAPSATERDVFALLTIVLERLPRVVIRLGERAVINGVSAAIHQNWKSKKYYWTIGGVNPKDEHFDSAIAAFNALKSELSTRGLICLISYESSEK